MTKISTWPIRRARFAFIRRDIRGVEAPLASATKDGVFLRTELEFSVWNPGSDISNYKLVESDDFVIGLRSFQHGISHSTVKGIVSPAYTVLRAAPEIDPHYYKYYFRSSFLISQLANITQGIRQGQAIDIDAFRNLDIPVPPLHEQRRIADFLDAETARIDTLVRRRVQMRGLLTLKRERSIEDELGIADGTAPLVPLKYLATEITVGIVITPAKWYVEAGGTPALRGINVKPAQISLENLVEISKEGERENQKSRLEAGDVVVVRTGQAGAAAVVPRELDGANCIDLILIRPGPDLSPRFVEYVLNSDYARERVAEHAVGSIQAHFNVGAMKEIPFPAISRTKQDQVVATLDEQIGRIDNLLARLLQQETLLAERRQALITAAVTGQVDVSTASGRGVAEGVSP
ncbi:restriction endonuclease subunit S [Micromonospora endophytica]|uniref:Restriction endonuclease subunit S n=1 Tax=Micromonospora endophytica TaxID=515350 RepID=A0A2W2D6Q4_9ACTN|nr:restriction endonuclease subunit S [Micromonospora endophytica]PZG01155.1 restriction endonuclease subunit S [Micromonospora endophytica]RIW42118.1 restriction endonuclease subunit S [Micromonospora endophytica]BCJ61818.1 hypothetical protein Jiend_52400 [Micromonospora endophytica]